MKQIKPILLRTLTAQGLMLVFLAAIQGLFAAGFIGTADRLDHFRRCTVVFWLVVNVGWIVIEIRKK